MERKIEQLGGTVQTIKCQAGRGGSMKGKAEVERE